MTDVGDEEVKMPPSFNPFDIFLPLLAAYGWWLIGLGILFVWGYGKIKPSLIKWQIQREDAAYHKDPDAVIKKMEAIEIARVKQQQKMEQTARDFYEKENEKLEKKRLEYIDKNSGQSGQRLGNKPDYLPLCGPGTSGGYKPTKKKCPGGGCGR